MDVGTPFRKFRQLMDRVQILKGEIERLEKLSLPPTEDESKYKWLLDLKLRLEQLDREMKTLDGELNALRWVARARPRIEPAMAAVPAASGCDQGDERLEPCPICLEDLRLSGRLLGRLHSCSHLFHLTCIQAWAVKGGRCPLCRALVWGSDPRLHMLWYAMYAFCFPWNLPPR